jgi:cysteine desulfuration protein SufE
MLPELPPELQVESNTVKGCMSTVWMVLGQEGNGSAENKVRIQADSDSLIIKGLIVVLLSLFDNHTPKEIIDQDERQIFTNLGLDQNLSPQRRNGLFAMVQRIKQRAVELASGQ